MADLRLSFEKTSQHSRPFGGVPGQNLPSEPSRHSIRRNWEPSPPLRPKYQPEASTVRSVSRSETPPLKSPFLNTKHKAETKTAPSPQNDAGTSAGGTKSSATGSYQYGLPMNKRVDNDALYSRERLKSPAPATDEQKGSGLGSFMDGSSCTLLTEQQTHKKWTGTLNIQQYTFVTDARSETSQPGVHAAPMALSPSGRPIGGLKKVSQLRRFFEKSSRRSPLESKRPRWRLSSEELVSNHSRSPWHGSESPISTQTIARVSPVPSLITEISVNDFSCDFIDGASQEQPSFKVSPNSAPTKQAIQTRQESPVKYRIQQFERLSRDSLRTAAAVNRRGKPANAGTSFISKYGSKWSGKLQEPAGWRPLYQKGSAIWRKVSDSFKGSLEGIKGGNLSSNPPKHAEGGILQDRPDYSTSLVNDSKHNIYGSSVFGYSMHRVAHRSGQLLTSSQTVPNIQLDGGGSLDSRLEKAAEANEGRSLIVRKSNSILTRISSGLRRTSGAGPDGHHPSKPMRNEDSRLSEALAPAPSIVQGDSDSLSKVMVRRSMDERNRRRQGEKQLYKKPRTFTKWKGKGRADDTPIAELSDGAIADDEMTRRHRKAKGKGKEKESTREQPSGEAGTNKKTESGFTVFESTNVKLRHPRPRRPGPVRKLANMYREKGSSGVSFNTKGSSGIILKESRQGFKERAGSALGLRGRKNNDADADTNAAS